MPFEACMEFRKYKVLVKEYITSLDLLHAECSGMCL